MLLRAPTVQFPTVTGVLPYEAHRPNLIFSGIGKNETVTLSVPTDRPPRIVLLDGIQDTQVRAIYSSLGSVQSLYIAIGPL
jgi:hypothetical protein